MCNGRMDERGKFEVVIDGKKKKKKKKKGERRLFAIDMI